MVADTIKQKFSESLVHKCLVYPREVRKGSVVVCLDLVSDDSFVQLKKCFMTGELVKIIETLFNSDDVKKCLSPGHFSIEVSIAAHRKTTLAVGDNSRKYDKRVRIIKSSINK